MRRGTVWGRMGKINATRVSVLSFLFLIFFLLLTNTAFAAPPPQQTQTPLDYKNYNLVVHQISKVDGTDHPAFYGGNQESANFEGLINEAKQRGWEYKLFSQGEDYTEYLKPRANSSVSQPPVQSASPVPPRSVRVAYPNGGEDLEEGRTARIMWDMVGDIGSKVFIQLVQANGEELRIGYVANTGVYDWQVGYTDKGIRSGQGFRIQVTGDGAVDTSDGKFSILPPRTAQESLPLPAPAPPPPVPIPVASSPTPVPSSTLSQNYGYSPPVQNLSSPTPPTTPPPSVSISTNSPLSRPIVSSISPTITITWNSQHATACKLNDVQVALSGSFTETLSAAKSYSISCVGNGGSDNKSVTVYFDKPLIKIGPDISPETTNKILDVGLLVLSKGKSSRTGPLTAEKQLASFLESRSGGTGIKVGSKGGPGAGKDFPGSVQQQARNESNDTCVFCGVKTVEQSGPKQSQTDHAIPRSRGGNNTIENAQNTCRTCNLQKGALTSLEFIKKLIDNLFKFN